MKNQARKCDCPVVYMGPVIAVSQRRNEDGKICLHYGSKRTGIVKHHRPDCEVAAQEFAEE